MCDTGSAPFEYFGTMAVFDDSLSVTLHDDGSVALNGVLYAPLDKGSLIELNENAVWGQKCFFKAAIEAGGDVSKIAEVITKVGEKLQEDGFAWSKERDPVDLTVIAVFVAVTNTPVVVVSSRFAYRISPKGGADKEEAVVIHANSHYNRLNAVPSL